MARTIIAFVATDLDGYIARPDGGVDWLFTDGDYRMSAFLRTIGTVLIGRKTYDFMLRYGMTSYPEWRTIVTALQSGCVLKNERPAFIPQRFNRRQ
jgi:dihydrofolate reductase